MGRKEAIQSAQEQLDYYSNRYSERVAHSEGIVSAIDAVLCDMEKHNVYEADHIGIKTIIDSLKETLRRSRKSEYSALDKVACYREIIDNFKSNENKENAQ